MNGQCNRTKWFALAMIGSIPFISAAHAQVIEVLYSEAPGDPTAVVPGAVDINGDPVFAEFKAMELFTLSPDSTQWLLKARAHLDSDTETLMMFGSGATGSVLAQEGQPIPSGAKGEVYDFFGSSPPAFNELNHYVFTARARGGDFSVKHKGMFFDGSSLMIVRAESDPALGLEDLLPNPSGDELFGNSFNSMHVLNNGTFGYHDNSLTNLHSSRRPAVFYNDTSFLQVGVSLVESTQPGGNPLWDNMDSNSFVTTPDGAHWILRGEDDGDAATDIVLVYDGVVVLREGMSILETTIADVFNNTLIADGTWFARGDDPNDNDWAVRNGVGLAATLDPIIPDATEHWGNAFVALTGNANGDWILAGNTDNADPALNEVIVLNGETVVVREGDPVDLNGNGELDDDAFIGRGNLTTGPFRPDQMYLTDDNVLWFVASLRNAAGEDLGTFGTGGDALLRIDLGVDSCSADIDGDGDVDFDDFTNLLAQFGSACPCTADLDGDDDVDFDDFTLLLAQFGPCP